MVESISVVLPAAGQGKRLDQHPPKAAVELSGTSLVAHTVRPFLSLDWPVELVIVEPPDESLQDFVHDDVPDTDNIRYVEGGPSRFASVRNGVRALRDSGEILLIHDAARPFVTEEFIRRIVRAVDEEGAVIPVLSIPDTVKRVRDGNVVETVDRDELFRAQTPQGFRRTWYEDALETLSEEEAKSLTDDAGVVQAAGYTVSVVEGDWRNFKITYPEDLARAEQLMKQFPG